MNIELAAYMCVVYYPFMILVVVKKENLFIIFILLYPF